MCSQASGEERLNVRVLHGPRAADGNSQGTPAGWLANQCSDPGAGPENYLVPFLLPECLVWLRSGVNSSHAGKRPASKPSWERQWEGASH